MFEFPQINHYVEKIPSHVIPFGILVGASTVALIGKDYIAPLVGSVTKIAIDTTVGCCGGFVGGVVGFAGSTICWTGCNTARAGITFMYSYAAKTIGSVSVWTFKHGREFMSTSNPDAAFLESLDQVKDWSKTLKACRNTLFYLGVTYFALHTLGLENAGAHLFPTLPFAAKTLGRWAISLAAGSAIAAYWTDKVLNSVRVAPPSSPSVNIFAKASVTCAIANGTMSQEEVNSYSVYPENLIDSNVHINTQQERHRELQVKLRDRMSRSVTLYMAEAIQPLQLKRMLKANFSEEVRGAIHGSNEWVEEQKKPLHFNDVTTLHNILRTKSPAEKIALEKQLMTLDLNNISAPTGAETTDQTTLRWLAKAAFAVANHEAVQKGIRNALMNSHIEPKPKDWQQFGLSLLHL